MRRRIEQVERAAQLLEARRVAAAEPRTTQVDVVRDLDGAPWVDLRQVCAALEEEADMASLHCEWADAYIRGFAKRLYVALGAANPYTRV